MFVFVLNYIMGYLQVRIYTTELERFVNLCKTREIYIWNICSYENYSVFNIYINDYFLLKEINRKTHSRTKIIKKIGIPFKIYKYRKHKFFVLGIITSIFLIYYLSLFVWEIDVEGNYTHSQYEIINFLKQNNIYLGIRKTLIDCDSIEKMIRSEYDDVTWTSVEMAGTRIVVHIKENFEVIAENTEKDKYTVDGRNGYNIVAAKNATIYSIVTRSGKAMVKKDDEVKKGDLLIEGKYDVTGDYDEYIRTNYVVADGDVWGSLKYKFEEKINRSYTKKVYTGNEKTAYEFLTGDRDIKIDFGKVPYDKYDIVTKNCPVKFMEDFILPVNMVTISYREYHDEKFMYTDEEMENILNDRMANFLKKLSQKGIQIIENNVKIEITDKMAVAKGKISVIEKIGSLKSVTYEQETEGAELSDE